MLLRWQVFLDRTRRSRDPAFAPWHALAGGVLIGLIGGVALFFVSLVFGSGKKSRRR